MRGKELTIENPLVVMQNGEEGIISAIINELGNFSGGPISINKSFHHLKIYITQPIDIRAELEKLGISAQTAGFIEKNSRTIALLEQQLNDLQRNKNRYEQASQEQQAKYNKLVSALEGLSKKYSNLTDEQQVKDANYKADLNRIRKEYGEEISRLENIIETQKQTVCKTVSEMQEKMTRGYSDIERAAKQKNDALIDEIAELKSKICELEKTAGIHDVEPAEAEHAANVSEVEYEIVPVDVETVKSDKSSTAKANDEPDAKACFNKGFEYYNKANYAEAVKWYRKAAEQGGAKAQYNLGLCYHKGIGVEHSHTEAVKWWRKAAEQGLVNAQHDLGVSYATGTGVEQSYTEAVKWYRKAAEQGYANAQNDLGISYEFSRGVAQSYAEAVKWYRKAAEQGLVNAQHDLGWRYEYGQG